MFGLILGGLEDLILYIVYFIYFYVLFLFNFCSYEYRLCTSCFLVVVVVVFGGLPRLMFPRFAAKVIIWSILKYGGEPKGLSTSLFSVLL